MIFATIDDVDAILGADWTTQDKKTNALLDANTWLSAHKFCKGLDPIAEELKQAAAYLARMSASNLLYVTTSDGLVTEKTVKADTVQVTKKFAVGQETGKQADMLRVEAIIKLFLCSGVGNINGWVCK